MSDHRQPVRSDDLLLDVRGVDAAYGPLQVLFGVDLQVAAGEVVALLGTNGAGKSTLLRTVSGLLEPSAGTVRFDGADLTREAAAARVRRGLVQVPGGRATFPDLTVAENLRLAGLLLRDRPALLEERTEGVLDLFPSLRGRFHALAGTLSGGERQMLALAKGLLLDPVLLCIDELSLGLAPIVVEQLLGVVEGLRERGTSMLVVEQSIPMALALSDRAVFIEKGHIVYSGRSAEILAHGDVVHDVVLGGVAR